MSDRLSRRTRHGAAGQPGDPSVALFEPLEPRLLLSEDLTGSIVSVSLPVAPGFANAGTDFVAVVNVTNLGSSDVDESISVAFWLTQDGIIDGTNDVYIGHEGINLHDLPSGGGTVGLTADDLHLPSATPTGNYFLVALVDSNGEVTEPDEANNWLHSPWATPYPIVGGATGRDLTGTIVSVSLPVAPVTSTAGTDFTAVVNVTNLGGKDVNESISLAFWVSQDGIIDGTNDVYVGHETINLHDLPQNGVVGVAADDLHLPSTTPAGDYFLVSLIDSKGEVPESNEANNWIVTSYALPYTIVGGGGTGRDLTGTILSTSLPPAPATATAGDDFVATINITNLGGKDISESISVAFWMTQDGIIDGTNDVYVGHETINLHDLPTNGVVGLTADGLHLPSATPAGTYYMVALVDSKGEVAETDEANNWIASTTPYLIVGGGGSGMDLTGTILSTSLPPAPATATAGDDFVATINITNLGGKDISESISVAFWMTQDGIIDGTNDVYVGHETINLHDLPTNGVVGLTAEELHLPSATPAGTYYILAIIDSKGEVAETDEANNWIASTTPYLILGGGTGEDLTGTIVSHTLPPTVLAGYNFDATINITNLGSSEVDNSISVAFWLTQDGVIDGTNDVYVGHESINLHDLPQNGVVGLVADGLHLPSTTPAGTYYLLGLVDSHGEVTETNEANNWTINLILPVNVT